LICASTINNFILTKKEKNMGAASSILSPIMSVVGLVSSSQQSKERNRTEERLAADQAALNSEKRKVESEAAEQERRNALKRSVARQRASFGAQGVTSVDGSSEAVLLGMFDESEDEKETREKLDSIKERMSNQNLAQLRQINLLEQSQQRERQRIQRLSDIF
jgi:colicin import membrane protein